MYETILQQTGSSLTSGNHARAIFSSPSRRSTKPRSTVLFSPLRSSAPLAVSVRGLPDAPQGVLTLIRPAIWRGRFQSLLAISSGAPSCKSLGVGLSRIFCESRRLLLPGALTLLRFARRRQTELRKAPFGVLSAGFSASCCRQVLLWQVVGFVWLLLPVGVRLLSCRGGSEVLGSSFGRKSVVLFPSVFASVFTLFFFSPAPCLVVVGLPGSLLAPVCFVLRHLLFALAVKGCA